MSNQTIANRYAVALFQLAKEKHQLKKVNEELQVVKDVVQANPDFLKFISHPKITKQQKQDFIKKSFASLNETTLNTFLLLIESNRMGILVPMIDQFKSLVYDAEDMAEALVYSAQPLSDKEQNEIAKSFAKQVKKSKLEVINIVDSKLIGGVKIRIGDRIYDGTIKAQLDRLERQLVAGTR
ncbi:F0F1 ATP synthase subunit delta [Halalkalibacter akibai]|uniref:ATP synthase subunit delta n=1 Tax=Halalkalibacter akibai (strain ATCC 43226 / DSM 21942 / CIP 109018 / JCM 9157 / 1139) TaxID=1236973 RepID=W4QQL9_HALA3|nr:F0F1 ATP synthase subunit delta [Halalkalibacter akibai]GAE33639.1 ATP synthase delta chain [Halalkalibacter akibai JCM 9157]